MQRKLNFYGFTVLEALLLLIVAGIIGGTGYYVWQGKQTGDKTPSTDAVSSQKDTRAKTELADNDSKRQYLSINEWGVEVEKVDALGSLTYTLSDDATAVHFMSSLETSMPEACAAEGVFGISREVAGSLTYPDGSPMSDSEAEQNGVFKHLGDYFYREVYPQIGCDGADTSLTSQIGDAYKEVFESLREE